MIGSPKIVVLGMMAKIPVPGVIWQTIHYLVGLERLGFEPYYVEAHGRTPSMLMETAGDDSAARAARLIDDVMRRFGFGDRWAYSAVHHDPRCFGIGELRLSRLYRNAALIVNLHGGTWPSPEMSETGRLVYLETDPVQLQIELHDGVQSSFEFLEPHSAFFTFAENLSGTDCGLPVCERFDFRPTRQPVLMDMWSGRAAPDAGAYTTVGNWRQAWREVSLNGETYGWSKDQEWSKFLTLPAVTGQPFELALSGLGPGQRTFLENRGWKVREALALSIDGYRDFITGSRAEFTVAKDQNVRFRTGWFSDRSATYLAAGRPVVTQDTGFGCTLPTGEGLFAVSNVDEAAAAIEAIESDPARHGRAAAEIAREHFDADVVLRRLLADVGLSPAAGAAANTPSATPHMNGRLGGGRDQPTRTRTPMTPTSVIIPCFDLGEFLGEAVDSVLAQTRPPEELIVVDDGSADERTLDVLNDLRSREILVFRTANRGAPSARNYGIERARGEYILCLDADDILMPDYLQRTVACMDASPDVGIVATQLEFFGEMTGTWRPRSHSLRTMLWKNCLPSASLFRRVSWKEAGGYTPELEACHDWDLWLSIVERGWKWDVVEEKLYRYRRRNGSISDHREAHRPRITAEMMRRHQATYATHAVDAIVEIDGELRSALERLEHYKRDNAKQAGRIRALEEAARPPEDEQVAGFRALVDAHLPAGATALVVTKGDQSLLEVGHRQAWHFPRRPDGRWLGHHPRSDEEAIRMLEELRGAGAEYLCLPPKEQWWLGHYDGWRKYMSQTYSVVARTADGVIFDIRQEIRRRSFSVVICTYRRPELVAEAMRSMFEQEYPKDRYELIVVNNASPDETEDVVLEAARDCPVPFTYLVEDRNGLSYGRNTGLQAAKNEFIAFLDDDAIAGRDWMATFNGVIDEYHALVVGGRVEKAFEEGFESPRWLDYQYVKHFFGVNYRDRNRKEKVFRIRYPLYLTGANLIYARTLFEHFGGFDTRLGRDGKSLLGGEESYLNMVLDKHDIPIYYSDDAPVDHHIQSFRVTKKHLRSKAYWSGVTNAVMHPMFFGFEEVRVRTAGNRKEIKRRLRELRKEPRSPENFSRELRLIYNLTFLWKFGRRDLEHRLGRHRTEPAAVTWGLEQWIEDARGWTESVAKYERLRSLASEGDDQELAAEVERWFAERGAALARRPASREPVQLSRREYDQMVCRVRERVTATVPPGATVAIASKGDETLMAVEGRQARHFPQLDDGAYAGFYPQDDAEAVRQVEELRRRGASHLVFPATAVWWHTHYPGLARHLETHHECVLDEPETCVIHRLGELTGTSAGGYGRGRVPEARAGAATGPTGSSMGGGR
ncbi:MAG: glycosyltransferase [Actinomycetota bacterium]|nr:glycosyltransferase [Actinomycetota bacterium]